ncbi:MAG: hypothetical protein JW751_26905 [Polyangiaceae bacterium]|nr:hypothetical protein [Polyangiaceae bacterium]
MARPRLRGVFAWALLAVGGAPLLPGCLFCGGQTGECGTSSDGSSKRPPPCEESPLGYTAISYRGETAEQMLATLGGTYAGMAPLPATRSTPAVMGTLTFEVYYSGGSVTENSCSHDLTVAVTVALASSDGTVARTGSGSLAGSPASAVLMAAIPSSGSDREDAITIMTTLAADGSANGELGFGNLQRTPFAAARQP